MDYSSVSFIFFSAFSLIFYYLLKPSLRLWLLLILSLVWISSWNVQWAGLYFLILNLNYFAIYFITQRNDRDFFFKMLLGANAIIFVLLKSDLLSEYSLNQPYGLSFFLLMIAGMVIDQWRDSSSRLVPWTAFMTMPVFFPLLMAGPIERGRHFLSELSKKRVLWNDLSDGIILFSLGFIRRMFLTEPLNDITSKFSMIPPSIFSYFMDGFFQTFNVYIELSSFALMGRGIAKLFGIDLPLSFRPIYYSKSPSDFWARWNITLGTWIRDYLTMPMMLKFGRRIHQNYLIIFSFLLVGLWHAIEIKWLVFGLFNGLVIAGHNLTARKIKSKVIGRIFAFVIIIGNGLILVSPTFDRFEAFDLAQDHLDVLLLNPFSIYSGIILILALLIELIEEIKNDQDWFLKTPILLRLGLGCILAAAFIWALQADLIAPNLKFELPVYFKI